MRLLPTSREPSSLEPSSLPGVGDAVDSSITGGAWKRKEKFPKSGESSATRSSYSTRYFPDYVSSVIPTETVFPDTVIRPSSTRSFDGEITTSALPNSKSS